MVRLVNETFSSASAFSLSVVRIELEQLLACQCNQRLHRALGLSRAGTNGMAIIKKRRLLILGTFAAILALCLLHKVRFVTMHTRDHVLSVFPRRRGVLSRRAGQSSSRAPRVRCSSVVWWLVGGWGVLFQESAVKMIAGRPCVRVEVIAL